MRYVHTSRGSTAMGCVLFVFALAAASPPQYQPLGRREKKQLCETAQALGHVIEQGDTASFLQFAPGMLQRYASVLIQPDTEAEKAIYQGIERMYDAIIGTKSVSAGEKSLPHVSEQPLSEIEKARLVAQVSTARTLEQLRRYQERYGDIIGEELQAFERKIRDNHRQRIMRDPTIEEWILYRQQTGESNAFIEARVKENSVLRLKRQDATTDDFQLYIATFGHDGIREVYEQHLYARFSLELTLQTALEYLDAFPTGERAGVVKTWLDLIERQAMSDLAEPGVTSNAGMAR